MKRDYSAVTRGITVRAQPFYLEDQSSPGDGAFVWAYQITIENGGSETVQVRRRTWRITDATGTTTQVHGEGVIGEQPVLKPGEHFEYTSGTKLATPSGFMEGEYHLVSDGGEAFDIAIPPFSLDSPHQAGRLH